jgi:uncharacterized protein (DUF697 family)
MALAHRVVAIYPSGTTDPNGTASQYGGNYSASYTSMSAMEAAENGDLSAGDGTVLHVEIIPSDGSWSGAPDDSNPAFDGWKTDKAGDGSFVEIKTYGSARSSDGNLDTTAYILKETGGVIPLIIDNDANSSNYLDVTFDGVQVQVTTTVANAVLVQKNAYHGDVTFSKCYVKQETGAYGFKNNQPNQAVTVVRLINSILEGPASATGFNHDANNGSLKIYNSTITGWSIGINCDLDANCTIKNCAVFNNGNDFNNTTNATIDECASDDGDGTNAIDWTSEATDWNANFTDYSTGDFTIKDTNADIYHSGEDQTADSEVPTDDIIGTARPTGSNPVSIGAFEWASTGTTLLFVADIKGDTLTSTSRLDLLRKITQSSLGDSLTSLIRVSVLRKFINSISGDSLLPAVNLNVLRSMSGVISGDSLISSAELEVLHKFVADVYGDSLTSSAALEVLRKISASLTGDSLSSNVNLSVVRKFVVSAIGDSLASDQVELLTISLITFIASILGESKTSSVDLDSLRKISTMSSGESVTSNSVLNVLRKISVSSSGDTLTSTVELLILRLFVFSALGDSNTTNADLILLRKFVADTRGNSLTSDAQLDVFRKILADISGDTLTPLVALLTTELGTIDNPAIVKVLLKKVIDEVILKRGVKGVSLDDNPAIAKVLLKKVIDEAILKRGVKGVSLDKEIISVTPKRDIILFSPKLDV